mmetsp:Transcript_30606/g.70611  ORF Transcript_30606/g.70611 Transcript_30606/m.70611 type:complete len:215 (+) Transcript_30606:724-1368(+)
MHAVRCLSIQLIHAPRPYLVHLHSDSPQFRAEDRAPLRTGSFKPTSVETARWCRPHGQAGKAGTSPAPRLDVAAAGDGRIRRPRLPLISRSIHLHRILPSMLPYLPYLPYLPPCLQCRPFHQRWCRLWFPWWALQASISLQWRPCLPWRQFQAAWVWPCRFRELWLPLWTLQASRIPIQTFVLGPVRLLMTCLNARRCPHSKTCQQRMAVRLLL